MYQMRGKQSKCLLCRHSARSRSQFQPPRRLAATPSAQPFVLPRLVIDLDAADSTFVRKVDEAPVSEELKLIRRVNQNKSMGRFSPTRPKVALKTLHVTSVDLWAYALLGIKEFSSHQDSQALRNIIKQRPLHPTDSANSVIKEILSGFSMDPETNLQQAGFGTKSKKYILDEMKQVKRFSRLRRMVSWLSTTRRGCQFLVENGGYIMAAIRTSRAKQEQTQFAERVSSEMVLDLFNNLQINLESKGLLLGPELCYGALYYAAASCNIAAVKMYLQLARKHIYKPEWRTRMALRTLCMGLANNDRGLDGHDRRSETLELITGWRAGTAPRKSEARTICFAYLSFMDTQSDFAHSIYPSYIVGLGELGLRDAVYAEYMSPDPKRMSPILLGDGHMRFRAQMFAIAFLLAKDEKHALEVLESIPPDHEDITLSADEQTMRTWRPSHRPTTLKDYIPTPKSSNIWLLSLFLDHYSFRSCSPWTPLREHLAETIPRIPKDPKLALQTLRSLLMLDLHLTRHSMGSSRRKLRPITWNAVDGKEGIRLATSRSLRDSEYLGEPTF